MVSKGEMWVFDSSCITQPQSQITTDWLVGRIVHRNTGNCISMVLSMLLRDAVMSYAGSRYLTLWLRDAGRVKCPHFTLSHH